MIEELSEPCWVLLHPSWDDEGDPHFSTRTDAITTADESGGVVYLRPALCWVRYCDHCPTPMPAGEHERWSQIHYSDRAGADADERADGSVCDDCADAIELGSIAGPHGELLHRG